MVRFCTNMFHIIFLTWASISHAAADVNLTLLSNATDIVQSLDYTSNCTLSISWYDSLPKNGAGSGNDSINIEFLRSALPTEYENKSDAEIASFYDAMSNRTLSSLGWLGTAKDDIETSCIAAEYERQVTLANLDPTQNCTATAIFLGSLGWITGAKNYTAGSAANDTAWLEFLRASLPAGDRSNLTDLELLVYRNFFLASANAPAITTFLKGGFDACQKDICEVQGYTGNPDIGGIGVISSYTVEASLVTLYFVAINFQIWLDGTTKKSTPPSKMHTRIKKALEKASDGLADGALFFSLSISTAGWVSFVNGTSYYEKLVFTSANVLALSALFAFLGMFTKEGRRKRGEYILAVMIFGILIESAVQYIVYLKEPNDRYSDYDCLHLQFTDEGYHPTVFEALFFLLLGLSVLAGIVGTIWLVKRPKAGEGGQAGAPKRRDSNATIHIKGTSQSVEIKSIEKWIAGTRIFVQIVAITVMWVELVYLWKIRAIMAKIAGSTWSEGTWGFGQILALFIWVPTIIDILGWLFLPNSMLGGDHSKKCTCCGKEAGDPCTCTCGAAGFAPFAVEDEKTAMKDTSVVVEEKKSDVTKRGNARPPANHE